MQPRARPRSLATAPALEAWGSMLSFFMAGPDLVRWELTGHTRPYRLTIYHAHGAIVEYFDDVTAALLRQGQLEELLMAARGGGRATTDAHWVDVPLKERSS